MIKKLYQKGGIVFIDNSEEHKIGEIDKNYFIINELSKNNNIQLDEILKKFYESKGFSYVVAHIK
jgi:hypothetical protein|tara:strand:+ start:178 stop:372 length:195 start_codon:yes stop_codon:yes gene_type:complete